MSTHRAEIDHFVKTVEKMGGNMTLHVDSRGYVDSISVSGLEGIKDFDKSAPIHSMEQLRPVVGPIASAPTYSKEFPGAVGLNTMKFSHSQANCYGGLNVLVNIMKNKNKIWEGEKFAAVIEEENPIVKFYCLNDGDILEFKSASELNDYVPTGPEVSSSY